MEVQLACRLFFVDLEGLNDGRAVKTIVPQVNPRKMVSRPSCLRLAHSQLFLVDSRPRAPRSDRRSDRELCQYSSNDEGNIRPFSRGDHPDWTADQQLLDLTER